VSSVFSVVSFWLCLYYTNGEGGLLDSLLRAVIVCAFVFARPRPDNSNA
jgi:hypothetical protein